jgi:hypothetical protein
MPASVFTNFEYKAHAMAGNGNQLKIGLEKFVKPHQVSLFSADF